MNQIDDLFARIATQRVAEQDQLLHEPQPPDLARIFLPAARSNPAAAFRPLDKIDTPRKLQRELERQRRHYARFLRNLAPAPETTRTLIPLDTFDWRLQGAGGNADDFAAAQAGQGEWQPVHIPHFGGPIGKATAYYRTTFALNQNSPEPTSALFIHFDGVDYKAHVFVNGVYLGSHEGFFAPFEFEFTRIARAGQNTLLVVVENDAIVMGNDTWDKLLGDDQFHDGDKLYAATGPGWDDSQVGWHHCPPGMGIVQGVRVEARAPIHIHNIFVRPVPGERRAEAWVEVKSVHAVYQPIALSLSVFGQNFAQTVFRERAIPNPPDAGPGVSYYRFSFDMPALHVWETDTPWLYQLQVKLCGPKGELYDIAARQFGMRSFRMDTEKTSGGSGRMYLNEREIRLRGANTMGFEQQDVMRKDWDQLRDDILLAKICHMNYWRITQRPVQDEVYEMCDRLGFLTQTDLPLFGQLRRNQFAEAVRQAEEMERLVRNHPCNVVVSYINEPFPNAQGKTHRHLSRPELERFFRAANEVVHLANPDRVIKAVDGDYDPPGPGLPDNHCYTCWYNGHGIELGKLHKGFWQSVKPGWMYGCGEFGAEGLDDVSLMRKYYPPQWLPQTAEEEATWSPNQITSAQTGRYHYMFFETPHTLEEWSRESRRHQAWATRLMTEAFRRDRRMNSFAIHLFIDAFPSGWMKVLMDVDRQPKPAYFAYREALTPLMANLRTDRHAYFAGEEMQFECWVCNDTHDIPPGALLRYQLELGGKIIFAQQTKARMEPCSSTFQGFLKLKAPATRGARRTKATLRLALAQPDGTLLHDTAMEIDVFDSTQCEAAEGQRRAAYILGARNGKAAQLARELSLPVAFSGAIRPGAVILVDDMARYAARATDVAKAVESGATVVFVELPPGDYEIAQSKVKVEPCGMGGRHFISRDTAHPLVEGFGPGDFKFWYDPAVERPAPLLDSVLEVSGWTPILMSGNGGWEIDWHATPAAVELRQGAGTYRICQVKLAGRLLNPVARIFAQRLVS
ncbi:MAG TPA: glycoside hydrolase family 2 TIM barrel-domain containing protein [Anaerolineae bacterium]